MYHEAIYLLTDKRNTMTAYVTAKATLAAKALLLAATLFCLPAATGFTKDSRHLRPFSGYYQLTVTVTPLSPTSQHYSVRGRGTATHLGRSSYAAELNVNQAASPVTFDGTAVFTAANGDQLFTTLTGVEGATNDEGQITIIRTFTVNGGTGRFATASGTITGTSLGTPGGLPSGLPTFSDITLEGTIDY